MTHNSGGKRKKAPTYSADTMALRFLGGIALIALGVVIFLATVLGMEGAIFGGLRNVCFGLCGALANLLPVIPVWAGVLVIWSTQKKAPVMPWLYGTLAFLGLCAFLVMVTHTSTQGYLSYLRSAYGSAKPGSEWGEAIHAAYLDGSAHRWSGGAAGTVFAWPLERFLGSFLGAVILFVLTAFCLLLMVGLTPSRLKLLLTGQAGRIREQQQTARQQNEEQQLAWQQEQMRQRELWQQEQQRILEAQQAANRQPQQGYVNQGWPEPTGTQPNPPVRQDIENWQRQVEAQRIASRQTDHESVLFGKKRKQDEPAAREEKPFRSRIFGRKKEENDGLTDPEVTEQQAAEGARSRRTVTDKPLTRPETRWTAPEEEAVTGRRKTRELNKEETETLKTEQKEPIEENRSEMDPPPVNPVKPEVKAERPVRQVRPEPEESAPEKKPDSPWSRQVQEALDAEKAAKPKERQVAVPAVQQVIGQEAYKPDLVLPPRDPDDHPENEEDWKPFPYVYPPITDLKLPKPSEENTAAEDEMRSRLLEETLASYKVQARVVNVTHGPAISRFELELPPGTKVNKVAELGKDIAYRMEATSIRIEAPIPGKSLVGVEMPNRKVAMVTLREVLESEQMQSAKSVLTVALGKDIAGTPIICDLARMPHLLIAGQTGSGKSVCVNAIINSLLYRATPDEVRLILVDPKVVELQCYNGIPHLLIPVVNDPHKAAAALAWAVAEMMERYDLFSGRKVRNLDGYNASLEPHEKPMARIVIIIDELADLMMVCKKEVEDYIVRLTQLARAAGIHLIVATQRPSVDVITGLIKANIPSRIAFKTASSVDSRTILDRNGSEQLLGWGDMMYLPTGSFSPTRVQGCFLSDEEVNKIAAHVRVANPSTYDPDILEKLDQLAGGNGNEPGGADLITGAGEIGAGDGGLFEQAVEFAIADGQISTSTLQRRLKIGYARAGRLTDEMEERGIVAAKDGSKPRKCLITREEWEEMKKSTEGMK